MRNLPTSCFPFSIESAVVPGNLRRPLFSHESQSIKAPVKQQRRWFLVWLLGCGYHKTRNGFWIHIKQWGFCSDNVTWLPHFKQWWGFAFQLVPSLILYSSGVNSSNVLIRMISLVKWSWQEISISVYRKVGREWQIITCKKKPYQKIPVLSRLFIRIAASFVDLIICKTKARILRFQL